MCSAKPGAILGSALASVIAKPLAIASTVGGAMVGQKQQENVEASIQKSFEEKLPKAAELPQMEPAPTKSEALNPAFVDQRAKRLRSLRAGMMSTIKTGSSMSMAPRTTAPELSAAPMKTKLGQ